MMILGVGVLPVRRTDFPIPTGLFRAQTTFRQFISTQLLYFTLPAIPHSSVLLGSLLEFDRNHLSARKPLAITGLPHGPDFCEHSLNSLFFKRLRQTSVCAEKPVAGH